MTLLTEFADSEIASLKSPPEQGGMVEWELLVLGFISTATTLKKGMAPCRQANQFPCAYIPHLLKVIMTTAWDKDPHQWKWCHHSKMLYMESD